MHNVPAEYAQVYNEITETSTSIDELKNNLNIDIATLNSQLTMLELDGYITQLPGGDYIRNES